jgi:NAD(P)-dependent dehydrogenase (short-subunit alcohol dehydrogenase family)
MSSSSSSREGKAVLITGGRSGIGRALAEGLRKHGYTTIVTVRREVDVTTLKEEAGIHAVVLDVTNDSHVEPAVEALTALLKEGNLKLTGVIANAGINPEGDAILDADKRGAPRPQELSDPAIATAVFATNVVGVARTARAFLPLLRESGEGRLLIVGSYFGSMAGSLGSGHLYYEASKHALEGLSDGLRRAEARRGVKVSLVKPGNISTNMNPLYGEDGTDIVVAARASGSSASSSTCCPPGSGTASSESRARSGGPH